MLEGLVYVGKVIEIADIPNADFIQAATVVCGKGGKWRGVIKKDQIQVDELCRVYMPDTIVPETEEFKFMEKSKYRIKMQRLRGCPSEVLIMPYYSRVFDVGTDITIGSLCTKYIKPVPAHLQGKVKGSFPQFIPKTDEPNFQKSEDLIELLKGQPYYVTEKADGSSTTAYKWKGVFGLCSRNLELIEDPENGYWKVANKYNLKENLPEGFALQWETCGPGVQSNPMGLSELDGFAFSVWDIEKQQYLPMKEFQRFCMYWNFPFVKFLAWGPEFKDMDLTELAKGFYPNGKPREGVVVRSQNHIGGRLISFKAINLDYKEC